MHKSKQTLHHHLKVLNKNKYLKPFEHDWEYQSVIGKLNFLEKFTRPDLSYSTHCCVRFSIDLKESHKMAVERIVKYVCDIKEMGLIFSP